MMVKFIGQYPDKRLEGFCHDLAATALEALAEVERLKEYEWMYKDLCK